jgi:hypothetical protein
MMFTPGSLERFEILPICPWFALRPSERIETSQLGPRVLAGSGPAKFGRTGGRDRPGEGGGGPTGSLGSIPTEVRGGGDAGGVERLRWLIPAAAPSAPASSRPVPTDGQCGQHLGGLVSRFRNSSLTGKGAGGGGARRGRAEATGGAARPSGGAACAREWPPPSPL